MFDKTLSRLCVLLPVFAFLVTTDVTAEAYPSRPIRMILPFPAGGGTDVATRLVAQEMSKTLGQSIVILNRPGAGGKIGSAAGAKEKADGYNIVLSSTSTMAVYPAIDPKLPYDALGDFRHAGIIATTPGVLVATKDLPAKNLEDLNKLLLDNPSRYVIGSGTPTTFLAAETYKRALNVNLLNVNYPGSPPLFLDLIPGRVHLTFVIAGAALSEINSGALKPIAITGNKRIPQLPKVGTMGELGMGKVDASAWIGFAFPRGTPDEAVRVFNGALNKALENPGVISRLTELGFVVEGGSPEKHTERVKSELGAWAKMYKDAGSPPLQ